MADPQDPRWKALQVLAGTDPISTEVPDYEGIPPAPRSWSQHAIDSLESHQLPVHVPAGQDPWAEAVAQRMTGHPGTVQGLYNAMASDPGNYVLAPPMIAVSEATVPLFQKAVEAAETGLTRTGHPLVDKALAWLETRTPRFANQVPVYAATESQLPMKTLGAFTPAGKPYVRLSPAAIEWWAKNWAMSRDPLASAIQTLAHEMTHARQFTKMGLPKMMEEVHAGVPYEERQIEKAARRAGATAYESYQKYLEYLNNLSGAASSSPVASSPGPPGWTTVPTR